MKNNIRTIAFGFSLAGLFILASCATTAQEVDANHQIAVTLDDNNVVSINQNDSTKAVRAGQILQWRVVAGTQLTEIEIVWGDKDNCKSTAAGTPCQNNPPPHPGVFTCALKPDLGPDPATSPDPDFHDYCYSIRGYDKAGDKFAPLDPIVRGRR